ncbi:MAG: ABC transporter permease [Acidobacteriota bacterium]
MKLLEVIADGIVDVRAHGGRTALQTIGVVLGVASVIATMGLTAGGRQQSLNYMAETGGVLKVMVYPRPPETVRGTARERSSRGLTLDDAEAIRASIPGFELVEPAMRTRSLLRSPRASKSYPVTAVAPGYAELHELRVARGRFLCDEDLTTRAAVVVLGADRAHEFFGSGDAVGQVLRIGDTAFRVVGVLERREFYWNRSETWNALGWMNELVLAPVTAMQARQAGAGSRRVDELGLRLASARDHKEGVAALSRLLLARHGVEDFQVFDRQENLRQMNEQGKIYDLTFLVCGIISLVVGGIVVANIMMASFAERVREVGVRKALGARGWHIFVQFLLESLVVTGFGGLAGLLLGVAFVHASAHLLQQQAVLTPSMAVAALACSASVGVVFGFFPALQAARLDPVVALRTEG